jgi:hypothetical protein
MPKYQLLRFTHMVNSVSKIVVESHCASCGRLIAAGPYTEYLQIAESAHRCSANSVFNCGIEVEEAQLSGAFCGPVLNLQRASPKSPNQRDVFLATTLEEKRRWI